MSAAVVLSAGCLSTPDSPAYDAGGGGGEDAIDAMVGPYDAGDGGMTTFDPNRLCVPGAAIEVDQHACAASVCARSAACCTTEWNAECVDLVALECQQTCSAAVATASHAAHAIGVRDAPSAWTSVGTIIHETWVMETSWADFDGDGDADLALGPDCSARIYRNDGYLDSLLQLVPVFDMPLDDSNGCWRMNMEWGDADDDGDMDLAVAGLFGLFIVENKGPGADPQFVAAPPLIDDVAVNAVAWVDYNKDGDSDLFAAVYEQPLRLYRNTEGVLTHETSWVGPAPVEHLRSCVVDDTADTASLVALHGPIDMLINQGQGISTSFAWSVVAPDGWYFDIACADLNDDGFAEVIASTRDETLEMNEIGTGHVRVLSGTTGEVVWTSPTQFYGGNIDVGDLDGDGLLDVVVADNPPGADAQVPEPFHVYLGNAGKAVSLTEEPGADFVPESDTTRIEIVDLAERK